MSSIELVRFGIPLGFYLPIVEGVPIANIYHDLADSAFGAERAVQATITFHHLSSLPAVSLEYSIEAQSRLLNHIGLSESDASIADREDRTFVATVIDVVTEKHYPRSRNRSEDPRAWPPLNDPILTGVRAANTAIRAVSHATRKYFPQITYESMPYLLIASQSFVNHGWPEVDEWSVPAAPKWNVNGVIHLAHMNMDISVRDEAMEEVVIDTVSEHAGKLDHPLRLYLERAYRVKHQYRIGQYADAVISMGTSAETLLTTIVAHLLWEEAWPNDQDEASVKSARLVFDDLEKRSRVREELSKRLGGNWSSKASPWEIWMKRGVQLRNRVVHTGHQPSYDETAEAVNAYDEFVAFVTDRIAAKANVYPRTAIKAVGPEGLEQRNKLTGKLKRFRDEVAPKEDDWEVSFTLWMKVMTGG